MISYKERLNPITTFIFDIDGVLTDGQVILTNDEIVRSVNSRDSFAIQHASRSGYKVFLITGGRSEEVKRRFLELGVTEVHLGSSNKLEVYKKIQVEHGFTNEQVLYMGDDIPDYPVMQLVGCATCPQDAAVEVKHIAHYQSPYNGGRHAVRDVIEQTMRLHDKWFTEGAFHW